MLTRELIDHMKKSNVCRNILAVVSFISLIIFIFTGAAAALPKDKPGAASGGESCGGCHSVFDAEIKAGSSAVEEKFDTVVIGGGLSGLAALYYLGKGNNVLLESENVIGGQMKYDTWKGKKFAAGTSYCGEPFGIVKSFFKDNDIQLKKIGDNDSTAWIGGKFYRECWGDGISDKMPWSGKDAEIWNSFLKDIEKTGKEDLANLPVEDFDKKIMALDNITAFEYMTKKGLTKEMIDHINLYVRSCFGEPADKISAAAFLNFISGDIISTYTIEGGMGAAISVLADSMKKRIRTSTTVTAIIDDGASVTVIYRGPEGKAHTIKANSVIMAVASRHLPKLIKDLPAEKKSAISKISYASYLVAAVLCKEVFWADKGYDMSVSGAFFTDIIDADWISRGGKPHANKGVPHVLSVYIPMGAAGKGEVMAGNTDIWKEKIIADIEKIVPGCRDKIEDVRFYRFGHSMHVPAPGFLSETVKTLRKPFGRIFFAGVETEGLPCVEAAIIAGHRAVSEFKKKDKE